MVKPQTIDQEHWNPIFHAWPLGPRRRRLPQYPRDALVRPWIRHPAHHTGPATSGRPHAFADPDRPMGGPTLACLPLSRSNRLQAIMACIRVATRLPRTAPALPLRVAIQQMIVGSHHTGSRNRGGRQLKMMPNHSLERTRPRRRENGGVTWPGRSARGR